MEEEESAIPGDKCKKDKSKTTKDWHLINVICTFYNVP